MKNTGGITVLLKLFQKEVVANLCAVVYPKYLKFFEKALEAKKEHYLVGDSVSLNSLKQVCTRVYAC